jgi:hypothetical protein
LPLVSALKAHLSDGIFYRVVTNIPGTEIARGDELAPFFGSGPPKDSGKSNFFMPKIECRKISRKKDHL